ncbi:efflux RND transporter periplasmic adaptor subunit [Dechloromonas sp.]|uniref:efflux RND transporter periplasmic adaptor subunit n=1 Tax=Dechloromonas sp. TaxID=1917218 RepID=UPI0011F62617|nr:efflux RND transporter periplasmic adaptor subunit [Dechloromonas sp.]MBU3697376.1 efflux RND transporter periplasmic adaptor subunit [Dechloromonas sp.]TEX49696.1 MAG: efflux transporter periplasmic adaptor subunit [Rhodocyclaceae bacterium]
MSRQLKARIVTSTLLAALLSLVACKEPAKQAAAPLPEVVVETVVGHTTPLTVDLVSEIKAYREVDLYPRVSGVIVKQTFKPGQKVKEGELLFNVDPRAYDEAIIDAQAKLAESEAVLSRSRQDVARYKPLLPDNAIPRQTYDQAVASEQQNAAVVQARRAGLEKVKLDRSYADVRSPIAGQIGLQKVEVGGLATAGQTVLATVSTLDPVVAYFSIPEVDYINFARRHLTVKREGKTPIELILADGSTYAQSGTLDFADRALNPATGTLTLRAVFPNPDGLLRPGMNTRVRIVYEVAQNALLIPQKAVTELLGKQFASVVVDGDKVEQRPIRTGARIGDQWLVEEGLKAGERIVVEGLQKAKPGAVVKPLPAKQN